MNPTDYRPLLPETTFQHLRNCFLALADKQHFAAAVWGAVFLEAFLDVLFKEFTIPRPSQDDLNGRIQQLRQFSKNRGSLIPSIPDEIVKRCDDIRNTRNRLVHDTGMAKNTVSQDAEFICAGLTVILDWYRSALGPHTQAISEASATPPRIPVFVSTVSPAHQRQSYFIEMILGKLRSIGIEPVRLSFSQFDRRDPIGKARRVIEACEGFVVIGLERSHAYFLRDKEGSDDEKEEVHRKYTSGWLHLEAGIAHAVGLDIFALCQADVCNDGIFDRGWNSYDVIELQTLDEDSPPLKEFLDHLSAWVELKRVAKNHPTEAV